MTLHSLKIYTICLGLLSSAVCISQTTITLGGAEFESDNINIEAPYNSQQTSLRSQTLILASELQAEGLTAGEFTSLQFHVSEVGSDPELDNFFISIGNPDSDFGIGFEDGATEVIPAASYTPVLGWNIHTFSTSYFWDGTSDIFIESCYQNGGPGGFETVIWFSFTGNDTYKKSDHFGGNPACDDENAEDLIIGRPQLRLTWQPPMSPPIADISIQSITVCSGEVFLEDNSQLFPDTWLWYFGDGTTSSDENPSHIYSESGTYTVSLVVSNAFGTDSIALVDAITVSLADFAPAAAACTPMTLDNTLGFGSSNVTLNGQSVSSSDGTVGYEDLTCTLFQLDQGVEYQLDITVAGPSDNHAAAWIDYNADGDFTEDEKILSQVTGSAASELFTVPAAALTDSTLRMRVMTDFYLLGEPNPCTDVEGGQAEDYSLRITPNITPPIASFSADPLFSCDGTVQFTDESDNVPTSWLWQFGDGNFSTDQDVLHTYVADGTYAVSLTVQNDFGQDDTVMTNLITVDLGQALVPGCAVQTTSYCCGYGLQEFNFEGISNSSEDGVAGYEDFSCEHQADVTAGMSYPVTAYTGDENPQDLRVYVDLDNDGSFNESELLFSSFNSTGHSGTMSFPLQVPNLETRLRMRVIADFVGNNNDGCTDTQFGQAEDYSIVIHPDTTPPAAGFTAAPLLSCDGIVSFTNNSTSYTSSLWHFGDGGTSDETEPTYTYVSEGTYTVSLVVQNDYGVDSLALVDYITVDFDAPCDTIWMPTTGTADVLTDCNGLLADDGGPDEPYSNNSSGTQTIDVGVGNTVRLEFSQFSFQFNNDFLFIYDGPNAASPLIGQYTGGTLPNGGIIESSGSSITLLQLTNFFGVNPGFLLEWSCQPLGIEDLEPNLFTVYPNPTENIINIDKPADVKIVSILITDIQGRALHETALERPSLDVSFLPSGNYFLQIRTAAGNTTKPLIIR